MNESEKKEGTPADSLRTKVTKGLFWSYLERFSTQIVSLLVTIVLSRLIAPEGHGIIAIVNIFISISEVFVTSGFGNALVQKKDADDLDFSSIFFFSLGVATVVYAILFICTPYIAKVYNNNLLIPLIRVMGLRILLSSFNTVQRAFVSKRLEFKKFFNATIIGTLISAVVGIGMAYKGFGVWALVGQYLSNNLINTFTLFLSIEWRPALRFSWERTKGLVSFGWKMLASSLLESVYANLRSMIIGVKFSETALAFYDKGKHFPELIVNNVNSTIVSVFFPAISSIQDDKERVRTMTRRSIQVSSYVMAPLVLGLLAVSDSMVRVLLTDVWLPCVPFLRIACLNCLLYPIHTANLQPVIALGRSDLYLRLEIIKKVVGLIILAASVLCFNSVLAIAIGTFVYSLACLVINSSHNGELFGYTLIDEMRDVLPAFSIGAVMVVSVIAVSYIKLPIIFGLIMQITSGAAVYILLSVIFKPESYLYLLDIVKKIILKKRGAEA